MRITAAASTDEDSIAAAKSVSHQALDNLQGEAVDLVFCFVSPHHLSQLDAALDAVRSTLSPAHFVGCCANGILSGGVEYEDQPAISLWAAALPQADLSSFLIRPETTPEGVVLKGIARFPEGPSTLIILGDPFSFPTVQFIEAMATTFPETQILGGMASAGLFRGENRLFCGTDVSPQGAVAVNISGKVDVRPVVSQGCRPFGQPMVITQCTDNEIFELGGKPALERLAEEAQSLDSEDRAFLAQGLHIGRAVDASQVRGGHGDFLVRNVVRFDQHTGSISASERMRAGQTVRFHLQDPRAASEELCLLLDEVDQEPRATPAGSLLFTCNGRGRRMFSVEHHDVKVVSGQFGTLPLAGFFAAGELGPIGTKNFLHGFTAVLALFSPCS